MPAIEVKTYIDADQLRRDVAINENDLSSAMSTQASLFTYYSELNVRAKRQVNNLELLVEIAEGKAAKKLREQAVSLGEKPVQARIDKEVLIDSSVIQAKRALNEAKHVASLCQAAVDALRQRRDMLVQMGNDRREDKKGELRIIENENYRTALESKKQLALEVAGR
jgi:hypothetical protein